MLCVQGPSLRSFIQFIVAAEDRLEIVAEEKGLDVDSLLAEFVYEGDYQFSLSDVSRQTDMLTCGLIGASLDAAITFGKMWDGQAVRFAKMTLLEREEGRWSDVAKGIFAPRDLS